MSTTYEVIFDNYENKVFYSGQNISGKVSLVTSKPKTIQGISITIFGSCKVSWETGKPVRHPDKPIWRHFYNTSEDICLDEKTYVLGIENGPDFRLKPGTHNFNFECALPENLPTSFTGRYGQIKYDVIITIERRTRYNNIFKQPFSIIKHLDLNSETNVKTPAVKLGEKVNRWLGCCYTCCCTFGSLNVKLATPYTGYVGGQQIPFELKLESKKKSGARALKVYIKQIVTYTSADGKVKKIDENEMANKVLGENLTPDSCKEYKGCVDTRVLPPQSINASKYIKIEYFLEFRLKMSCSYAEFNIPITIGTIPLKNHADNLKVVSYDEFVEHKDYEGNTSVFIDHEERKIHMSPSTTFRPVYLIYSEEEQKSNLGTTTSDTTNSTTSPTFTTAAAITSDTTNSTTSPTFTTAATTTSDTSNSTSSPRFTTAATTTSDTTTSTTATTVSVPTVSAITTPVNATSSISTSIGATPILTLPTNDTLEMILRM